MAERFITETWLRQQYGLAHGSEVHLRLDDRLTPSARELLAERQIRIRRSDEQGRTYLGERDGGMQRVHPLTSSTSRPHNRCGVCGSDVADKPALLTHLDNDTLVVKNHPRIALRGRLDTLAAHCVLLQHQLPALGRMPALAGYLADLRSYIGTVLRAEVTGELLGGITMGDMDADALHRISHDPLKYLQHDHIVPALEHGEDVALLNCLRADVREVELLATEVYLNHEMALQRADIVAGLNRLSSAVYVLMLLILVAGPGENRGDEEGTSR